MTPNRETGGILGNSTQMQELLRAVALWAADCAERALPIFEQHHPTDSRPRAAIEASRDFGHGKKRDKQLRILALAALRAGKDVDEPSKYAARAASLAAAVAYTHTDLSTGLQGVRQAGMCLGRLFTQHWRLRWLVVNQLSVMTPFIRESRVLLLGCTPF